MAPGVPKFTSFRPKPKENADFAKSAEPSRPEKHARSEKSSRNKSPDRRKGTRKTSRDRTSESRRRSEKPSLEKAPTERATQEDSRRTDHPQETAPSKVFFIDRRGDIDIVKYGSLNRYEVPDYRRYGYGYILGLPLNRKIDRDLSTDKAIFLTPAGKRREERLLTNKRAAQERTKAIRFIRKADEEDGNFNRDFIAFSAPSKRKRDEVDLYYSDGSDRDYRKIRDTKPGQTVEPDVEYESETAVDSVNAEAIARNSTLARRTRDHPDDLQAWLDLIEHQETIMHVNRPEFRGTDRQHLAEVRISIYAEALKRINDEESRTKLYCGMMSEGARTWGGAQMARKWHEVLTEYPSNVELWLKYLDFVQGSFSSFKYEACRTAFQKCLETMQLSLDTNLCLHVVVRLTSMIGEAGYQELALATWQALLEYNLLAPPDGQKSAEESPQMFEEFWESEVPRIGEDNAKGWRNYNADDEPHTDRNPIPLAESEPSDGAMDDFSKREADHISKLRYPGRTTDEIGEEDPFHIVLFSDIEVFLKLLPRNCDGIALLSAFLQFTGLPPLRRTDSDEDRYLSDPFLKSAFSGAKCDANSFTELVAKVSNCPIKQFQMTAELLFDHSFSGTSRIIGAGTIRNVLKLLTSNLTHGEALGEYLLALESNFFPNEAFRTAKQLLKARPTSLRLYNAYGIVESRRNNSAKADQVFSAALSMLKGETPFATPGSLELFYSWTWEALRQKNQKEALWRLVSLTGQVQKTSTDPEQAALLRARRALSDTKERALLSGDFSMAAMATSLISMLAYLSGGEKPEAALSAFSQLSAWFTSHDMTHSPAAELHAQYVAQFLTYHAAHAPIVKPSLLRETLERLITAFPNNTILLSVYAANEARFAIDDRVRSIMHRPSSDKDRTIVAWTFAIHYEMLRGEVAGSTAHSIRALFKKAEDDVGAHCPALWKQHVLFEIEEARKERKKRPRKKPRRDGKKSKEDIRAEQADQRVKDAFFRGVTQLPWCKEYMMMAFTHLGRDFLSEEELRKVYGVMVEKELRLYIEVEDNGL